jgi:hypothetical protein
MDSSTVESPAHIILPRLQSSGPVDVVAGVDLRHLPTGDRPLWLQVVNLYLDGAGLATRGNPEIRRTLVETALRYLTCFRVNIALRVGVASSKEPLPALRSRARGTPTTHDQPCAANA